MQNKNNIIMILSVLSLAACGGSGGGSSGGSSSGNNNVTNPDPIVDPAPNGDDNNTQGAGKTTATELSLGDLKYSRTSSNAYVNLRNAARKLPLKTKQNDAMIYKTISASGYDYFAAGFSGQYVHGMSASWFKSTDPLSSSQFKLSGKLTPTKGIPSKNYIYRGTYITTRAVKTDSARIVASDMQWNLDFGTGTFEGHDIPEQAVVKFDGTIDGNLLEGHVTSQYGRTEFEGGIFGPNAQEIGGGHKNGSVTGIFYGAYDENLTKYSQ